MFIRRDSPSSFLTSVVPSLRHSAWLLSRPKPPSPASSSWGASRPLLLHSSCKFLCSSDSVLDLLLWPSLVLRPRQLHSSGGVGASVAVCSLVQSHLLQTRPTPPASQGLRPPTGLSDTWKQSVQKRMHCAPHLLLLVCCRIMAPLICPVS